MGTIREAGVPTIFVLRLGISGQQIAEIETLVIRNQMAAENLDRVARPRSAWSETGAASEPDVAGGSGPHRQHVFLRDRAQRRQRASIRSRRRAPGSKTDR